MNRFGCTVDRYGLTCRLISKQIDAYTAKKGNLQEEGRTSSVNVCDFGED